MQQSAVFFALIIFFSCHPAQENHPTKAFPAPVKDTDDTPTPSIAEIVSEFRDSAQRNSILDTTEAAGGDTLRLVIRQEREEGGSFLLPKKYLEDMQLDSFRAWNMSSDIRFFVNGRMVLQRTLQKEDFDRCADASLRKYGVLIFPDVDTLDKKGFVIHYTLDIPMTDVGVSVRARAKDGQVICDCKGDD